MTSAQKAAAQFTAYDTAMIAHLFHGAAAPVEAEFGYRHGWVMVDGKSFCREQAFPGHVSPRFPADQGTND